MTPNAYGHSWPQQDRPRAASSSHLDRPETLAEIHSYDYPHDSQFAYADYAEPRSGFDPLTGAVWVPDPPPPPLLPTPAPVPYYGQELYYQRLNFGAPQEEEEAEQEDAALAYQTTSTTPLTPTTAYQTATAAAEIPYHHQQQQRYPPPQYSYQHFQRYPLAASDCSGVDDHPQQQQYSHVDKRPRFETDSGAVPGTFTALSGYRESVESGRGDQSSSYFHLPISSDPPPPPRNPLLIPAPITDAGGVADPRERAGPPPLSHSSAGVRWFRQDPLLPSPPPQPGPASGFATSHTERVYNGGDDNSGVSRESERGPAAQAAMAPQQQQQQQQRPSLATLSGGSGSHSTLGSATTVSSSSFSALSATSFSSIAPDPQPPPSGSPLAPPAAAAALPTRTQQQQQQQQQNSPSSYTPQQQRVSITVDHHHPGGTGEAIIESEQLGHQSQSQQSRAGGGGMMSPSSQQRYQAVPPASEATPAHGQQNPSSKKTQVSKSEKSCKACRIRKVRCSRTWPSCARCTEKRIDCHYGNLIPIDLVKGMHPDSRVAELEARIKMLEHALATRDGNGDVAASRPSTIAGMFSSPMPPPALLTPRPSVGSSAPTPTPSVATSQKQSSNRTAPCHADTADSFDLSCSSTLVQEDFGRTAYCALVRPVWEALVDPVDAKGTRKRHVDAVVASAKARAERLRNAKLLRGGHVHERGFGFEIEKDDNRYGAPGAAESEEDLFERMAREDLRRLQELKDLPIEELAQDPEWTRIAVWAVLDAHWATCSSNVPTIRPFHVPLRQARLYTRLDCLSPSERCIVLAFCAIGVRSTPNVGLLGLRGGPRTGKESAANEDGEEEEEEEEHLGLKREMVARIYRELMIDMYGRLEVAYGEPNKDSLEASLILALVQMWNEFVPRYSRSLIRTAINQYKELFENAAGLPGPKDVQAERTDLLMMYALPLLHIDSTTAAYLRAAPIITDADLATYFAPFKIPLFHHFDAKDGPGRLDLREEMRPWMDVDRIGDASHMQHMLSSMVIYRWLSACLRWCAQMSYPAAIRTPLSARALETLFDHLSTIHAVIQILQYHLVNQDGAPHATCLAPSPDGDTAEHIHLRWLTRLDRETDDATWLIFSIVNERLVREEMEVEDGRMQDEVIKSEDRRLDIGWLQACESRVRKGFKLAAFYFNFFTISPDPHQTHHLAFSLELIPNWTFLATQRFIPVDPTVQQAPYYSGLRSKADELTETELDWIERGLELAQKYHPVAERRLVEIRSYRLAEKRRIELLAADGVPVPVSRATALPPPRLGRKSPLSFQDAMKRALTQTVPSWA